MRVAIFRKGHFNAAHRLFNPAWDDDKNREVFGICSNSNFHGHNYDLEVKIIGELNPETGILMDLKQLKEIIETKVEIKSIPRGFYYEKWDIYEDFPEPYFEEKYLVYVQ